MSFWSLSWETFKIGGDIFTLGGGGTRPGPGAGSPAAVACIAATNWANRVAPAGGEPSRPGGPAGSTGPTGPGGPSGGGGGDGGGGGGASPPPGPPAPPPGGTGAAISNTQCNNKLNPTLLVDSTVPLLSMQVSWLFVCLCRLMDCILRQEFISFSQP